MATTYEQIQNHPGFIAFKGANPSAVNKESMGEKTEQTEDAKTEDKGDSK